MRSECFILCEDIRQENTGKFILAGVYLDNLIVNNIPATVLLRLWGRFYFDTRGDHAAEIRCQRDNDTIAGIETHFEINEPEKAAIFVGPAMPITITKEGRLLFQFREKAKSKRWRTFAWIDAKLREKKD